MQPGERILVLGLHAFVYLETDTLASSRLFYQYPLVAVDSDLRSELLREIEQSPPRVVVDAGYRPESGVWGQVLGQVGTALRAAGYERIDSAADPRLQPDMTIWVRR